MARSSPVPLCLFCGPFSSLLLMLSSRRRRRRVLSLSAVPSRWLRQPGPSFVLLFFPPLCGPFPSFGFSAALGLFSCCGPLGRSPPLLLSSRRRRRRFLSFFPVSRVLPVLRPYGPLMAFLSAMAFSFLLFVSLLPSGSQDLSFALFFSPPYGGSSRPSALLFLCPVLRSLYWARPILMYVFDFLFLFIVLGASIGRYRRREGYRLRRNSAQLVEMGDAGGAVNIILMGSPGAWGAGAVFGGRAGSHERDASTRRRLSSHAAWGRSAVLIDASWVFWKHSRTGAFPSPRCWAIHMGL